MAKPKLTPMLRHYLEVKSEHPDALLFYRMGDFFELFFEDAVRAAPILEVALTARHKGSENEVPMCGVPHHALATYLGRALKAGLRVAICDQVEDPAESKGLVKREVTRVVTPGTVSEPDLLESGENSWLAGIHREGEEGGLAVLDLSTGRFEVRRFSGDGALLEVLQTLRPRELLLAEGAPLAETSARFVDREIPCLTRLDPDLVPTPGRAAEALADHLGVGNLRAFGLESGEPAILAAWLVLDYARSTQQNALRHVDRVSVYEPGGALTLDATTLANLEVLRSSGEGGKRATLLGVLDQTRSPGGARQLKEWLRRPLRDAERIRERHEAVEELVVEGNLAEALRSGLERFGDPERWLSRAVLGSITPREMAALREGLEAAPGLLAGLAGARSGLLRELGQAPDCGDLAAHLGQHLAESPAASLKDGGVIADGVDAELDRCRKLARDRKQVILDLQAAERKATGISSLKIRFNKVFGYYIEVTKANQKLVPEHYIRKQTLVNAERYITPEIKELEEAILEAEGRQLELEETLYRELVGHVAEADQELRALAEAMAATDVLAGFSAVAGRGRWVRPRMLPPGDRLFIREGRHPVVESVGGVEFVPNDVELDGETAQIVVLTGPNMGGKSTYLRQVALLVLMAQAGSLLPAAEAEIGLCDRIFTRVGASDDLARGESTFMVEMIETARILHQASDHSLVILDEVGRGTATFDGLSLAWAIVEHLHETRRSKTLFATHYHELTELAATLGRVVNRTLAVKEWKNDIVFLRRVVPGSADKSYGLQVARLAGVPDEVVERAQEILANLEAKELDGLGRPRLARGEKGPSEPTSSQMPLFTPPEEVVASILRDTDIDQLTPLAALNLLQALQDRLG